MRLVPLLVFFCALCLQTIAQISIDSFYTKGSRWCGQESYTSGLGSSGKLPFNYTLGDDTVHMGQTYRQVRITLGGDTNKLFAGIRVDAKKVYFIMFDTVFNPYPYFFNVHSTFLNKLTLDSEMMLYDFGIKQNSLITWKQGNKSVVRVDSITVNGRTYKMFIFKTVGSQPQDYWIEGIGSGYGLFGPYLDMVYNGGLAVPGLCAYVDSSQSIILAPPGYDTANPCTCDVKSTVGLGEHTALDKIVSISPNPATGNRLNIQTTITIRAVSIATLTGAVSFRHDGILKPGIHQLHHSLPPGLYIISFFGDDGEKVTKKLQVQ